MVFIVGKTTIPQCLPKITRISSWGLTHELGHVVVVRLRPHAIDQLTSFCCSNGGQDVKVYRTVVSPTDKQHTTYLLLSSSKFHLYRQDIAMKMKASMAIVFSLLSTASSSRLAMGNDIVAGGLSERDAPLDNSKRTPVIVFSKW